MKTKTISRILTTTAVAALSVSSLLAQTNLGASCGCPSVASRPTKNLSTMAGTVGADDGRLTGSFVLGCDTTYILDKKIYVTNGKTLTIKPGSVIKAVASATPTAATALIIERGGKIYADGTESCPIVFTAEDDNLDGTYPITNSGKWGGIAILGTATNNLTVAKNGGGGSGKYCTAVDGVGFIEGFSAASSGGRDLYGAGAGDANGFTTFNDDDNSGILRYVSIRYAGTEISDANEFNGLSLGSVGRGTTIEHIDIISSDDDGIEVFGGTVNLKYISMSFGADDMLDWDLGWTGKAQFVFGIADPKHLVGKNWAGSSDNGFEMDADDNASGNLPASSPTVYNATIISDFDFVPTADNSGPAALQAKEGTKGSIYNSVFVGFRSAMHFGSSSHASGAKAYDNWMTNGSLIIKNNTFIGNTYKITTGKLTSGKNLGTQHDMGSIAPTTADATADVTKFTNDGNVTTDAATFGGTFVWDLNETTDNSIITAFDAVPNPTGTPAWIKVNGTPNTVPPNDGFFTPVTYRGAFKPNQPKSWLASWTYNALLKTTAGLSYRNTDIDGDGDTDVNDFLIFGDYFNTVNE